MVVTDGKKIDLRELDPRNLRYPQSVIRSSSYRETTEIRLGLGEILKLMSAMERFSFLNLIIVKRIRPFILKPWLTWTSQKWIEAMDSEMESIRRMMSGPLWNHLKG